MVILGFTCLNNLKVVVLGFTLSDGTDGGYPRIHCV